MIAMIASITNTIAVSIVCMIRANSRLRNPDSQFAHLDTLQRGVQWEGGAVDGGSIM